MREIVLDTETTGLSPKSGHRIVEIGCVELIDHMPTGKVYHQYINPERDIPEEVVKVHGITNEKVADEPNFAGIVDAFLEFIQDSTLVIHNAEFDMGFINAELNLLGKDELSMEQSLDTVRIARNKFPGTKVNLDALCNKFGIDNSNRTYHGALLDADLLAQVYLELIDGRQRGLSLANDKTTAGGGPKLKKSDKPHRDPRHHAPSTEELAAHAEFVGEIKDAVWGS
ncbi:MAG: DNA polymerase III subunit epsilon [Rhodospirillales bacterium]|nr:DNA polymerase III subunit epsilon [Rhodospirillales bacterium]